MCRFESESGEGANVGGGGNNGGGGGGGGNGYCGGTNGAVSTHNEDVPCGTRFTINCAKGCIRSMHHPQSCIPALFKSSDYFTVSQSPESLVVKNILFVQD